MRLTGSLQSLGPRAPTALAWNEYTVPGVRREMQSPNWNFAFPDREIPFPDWNFAFPNYATGKGELMTGVFLALAMLVQQSTVMLPKTTGPIEGPGAMYPGLRDLPKDADMTYFNY